MLSTTRPNFPRYRQLLITISVIWSAVAVTAWGQAAFSPPPPPQQSAASGVRGIAAPAQTTSPANIAPAVTPPAAAQSSTTTPITPTGAQPLVSGQIIARIDGQIVLASDVLWQVDQLIEANRDRIPPDKVDAARRALMRQQVMQLVDTKIIYASFRRDVPAENIPQIQDNLRTPFEESEVPRLVKMLGLKDQGDLQAMLRKSGTSLADVRQQFYERTIAGEWLRQMLPKPKPATHEEMLNYYKEHKKEYEYPAKVKWEEVMIRFDKVGGDRAKAWQQITSIGNEVWQRVARQPGLRGPVFTEIAKQKSHGFTAKSGGQHDWITQGALRSEEINQALFSLQVGQLSNPIESEQGFHIVRVLDRKTAGCTPFTIAQAEIREALKKNNQGELAEVEMAKLREKSRIWTIFEGHISGPELSRRLKQGKRR